MTRLAAIWSTVVFYLFMVGVTYGWMDATGWMKGAADERAGQELAATIGSLVWPLFWFWRVAGMVGKAVAG